ncbi:PAS domain-containing sensor histidine kinase, partial [Bacteroidota bacterium]
LIKIITHEINNSLTPITSLAAANRIILTDKKNQVILQKLENEDLADLISNNDVLEERSAGIRKFLSSFSMLTTIPAPNSSEFLLRDVFDKINTIFKSEFRLYNIDFKQECQPEDLHIYADYEMITQVLINLVKNSVFSLKEREEGQIRINALNDVKRRIIKVCDNGRGIEPDVINKIFIPFFTTKENGTGIGLSYSREIIRLHKGTIKVRSSPFEETVFEITLPIR